MPLCQMPKTPKTAKDDSQYNSVSLANLNRRGRRSAEDIWGEETKNRCTTNTITGWKGFDEKSKAAGFFGRADFIEHAGRGKTPILSKDIDIEDLTWMLEQSGFEDLNDLLKSLIRGDCEVVQAESAGDENQ